MARLTKEQRRELANLRDEGESDIVAAIRDLAACILRLDEEVEPVHPSHLTTVVEHLERERDEALARLASAERALSALRLAYSREADALASALDERDEARATLDAMSVSLRDRLAEAERERDEARAALATARGDALERLLAIEEQAKRVARAEKWVSMADLALLDANESDWWSSRDTWKRARAWKNLCNEAWTMACSGFQSERRKLYEMVGEGES